MHIDGRKIIVYKPVTEITEENRATLQFLDLMFKCKFTMWHNYAMIVMQESEVYVMPTIMPIRDLRNTSEISELAHKQQEPIFITKNGYSDLVVMSAELYDRFAQINKIDQAIYEAEKEVEEGGEPISMDSAMERLNQKYYG